MKNDSKNGASIALPLDEKWWIYGNDRDWPPDHLPILASYEKTRPGFELIVAKALEGGPDMGYFPVDENGYLKVCLWNVWEKDKDPSDSDKEKQNINKMQMALGELSEDDRYIRLQITCFARCFYTFPKNVDLILEGITSGQPKLDAGISCDPPWTAIRMVLHHRRINPTDPRKYWYHHLQGSDPRTDPQQKLIGDYLKILMWWNAEGDLECLKEEMAENAELAETTYRYLGAPSKLKRLYVQKLRWSLEFWASPSQVEQHERRWKDLLEMNKALDSVIQQALGAEENVIGKLIDHHNNNYGFPCHHAFFRHLDHIIAGIGVGKTVTLPGAGKERKRIHETIVNYVHVLGSWLAGRTSEEAVAIWPSCETIARYLYDILGNGTSRKRWLVACLWKKLQDDKAHRGRGALDEEPNRFQLPANALQI